MHATSTYSNLPWALEHLWDDDRTRDEARQLVLELHLATYDELCVPESEERGTVAMIMDRAHARAARCCPLRG